MSFKQTSKTKQESMRAATLGMWVRLDHLLLLKEYTVPKKNVFPLCYAAVICLHMSKKVMFSFMLRGMTILFAVHVSWNL